MTDFAWTEERVTELREMFAAGCHSSSEMAAVLAHRYTEALTRNAVIGKLSRMGLKRGRVNFGNRVVKPKREPVRDNRSPFRAPPILPRLPSQPPPAPPAAPSVAHQCDLMGLVNVSCRFPVTDESPWLFCAEPEADVRMGMPYCRFHARLAFNGKPERRPQQYRPVGDTWMPLGAAARNVVAGLKP